MEKDKNLLENDQLFKTLFEYSEENDEQLYKNDLFIPSTEEEEISQKNPKNRKEIIRDKILKKLSLEDYTLFPPKNDSILINDNNEINRDKEDQEKLFEEEIDHLRNLHRLNYLTFSPFGISFFPNLNSITQKNDDMNQNTYMDETDENRKKEDKILNIIDFDYNNYEINNDLLFNISMGFIDINKLKHENVVSSENFVPRSERFTNGRQLKTFSVKSKINENTKKNVINNNNIFNKDVDLKVDLMNKIVKFVKEHENVEFFSTLIKDFYKDLNILPTLSKNNEKNRLLLKWEKTFAERNKLYQKYLLDQQEKEKKKRKEERIRKEIEKKIEEQKMFKIRQERKFEQELEKIRLKGIKKNEKSRKSFNVRSGDIEKDFNVSKELEITPTIKSIKSLYTMRSASSGAFRAKIINKKSTGKNKIKGKNLQKKKTININNDNDNDNERFGYQKCRSDYFFKLI